MRIYFIYSGFLIGAILIGLGVYLLIKPIEGEHNTFAKFLPFLAFAYAGLRLWRSWTALKNHRNDSSEE